jgi:hypothetical protein
MNFAATIERAEKQIILAKHGRRLLNLLDDTPVVPGDARPPFAHGAEARQIINDAEEDLREWQLDLEPIDHKALESNLMPVGDHQSTTQPTETTPAAAAEHSHTETSEAPTHATSAESETVPA